MTGTGLTPPSKADQTARLYLEKIAKEIIAGREAFTSDESSVFEVALVDLEKALLNEPEITECEVDRVLTCRALEEVPEMVKRLTQMSKLSALSTPSARTGVYIREAARTYIYGFMQASAAMSRAALEQALKERLGTKAGTFIRFQDLVDFAKQKKILDDKMSASNRSFQVNIVFSVRLCSRRWIAEKQYKLRANMRFNKLQNRLFRFFPLSNYARAGSG